MLVIDPRLNRAPPQLGDVLTPQQIAVILVMRPPEDGERIAITRNMKRGGIAGIQIIQPGTTDLGCGVMTTWNDRLIRWTEDSRGRPTWSISGYGLACTTYESVWITREELIEAIGYATGCRDDEVVFWSEAQIDSEPDGLGGYDAIVLTPEITVMFRDPSDPPTMPFHWLEPSRLKMSPDGVVEAAVRGELASVDWAAGTAVYRCEVVP